MSIDFKLQVVAPSNIALVKYWGKRNGQLPQNSSISMTLNNCVTTMDCQVQSNDKNELQLEYYFEGHRNVDFEKRIKRVLGVYSEKKSWINSVNIRIDGDNSFPHSAGIASSASAFACLASFVESVSSHIENRAFDSQQASYLARLGSGSACRSITGNYNIWGESQIPHSNDEYAINFNQFHSSFAQVQDVICIVSGQKKSVSSSQGHQTMDDHPFAANRYIQANNNVDNICQAMQSGDWNTFGNILEQEALTLHALMMSSANPYILLAPNSLNIIQKVWQFRKETNKHLYFTIDAGPNIHLLYPQDEAEFIQSFIQKELLPFCEDSRIISDHVGPGVFVEFR